MHPEIFRRLQLISTNSPCSRSEAAELVALLPESRLDIYALARLTFSSGRAVPFACGIINAKSGRCSEDCAFCAQSAHHNAKAPVHALVDAEALLARARVLAGNGAAYMGIVISGAAPTGKDFEVLCRVAERITRQVPIKLCASLGLLDADQALALKQAGYASYHHNLESSRGWYGRICTTHDYDARVRTVLHAKEAGLRVCSGGIFGLGESWDDRLELAETLAELNVDSIPVNFLTPIAGTPLAGRELLDPGEALDIVAMLRLMHPERDVIICGGRAAVLGEWGKVLYSAGANAMMIGDYLTTRGGSLDEDRRMFSVLGLR
jgi:biotin synthase